MPTSAWRRKRTAPTGSRACASPWSSPAYCAVLNRIYIGTGNGSPWSQKRRSPKGGDNLYLSSIVALKPDTGEYVWHYQQVHHDVWDYDLPAQPTLARIDTGAGNDVVKGSQGGNEFDLQNRG